MDPKDPLAIVEAREQCARKRLQAFYDQQRNINRAYYGHNYLHSTLPDPSDDGDGWHPDKKRRTLMGGSGGSIPVRGMTNYDGDNFQTRGGVTPSTRSTADIKRKVPRSIQSRNAVVDAIRNVQGDVAEERSKFSSAAAKALGTTGFGPQGMPVQQAVSTLSAALDAILNATAMGPSYTSAVNKAAFNAYDVTMRTLNTAALDVPSMEGILSHASAVYNQLDAAPSPGYPTALAVVQTIVQGLRNYFINRNLYGNPGVKAYQNAPTGSMLPPGAGDADAGSGTSTPVFRPIPHRAASSSDGWIAGRPTTPFTPPPPPDPAAGTGLMPMPGRGTPAPAPAGAAAGEPSPFTPSDFFTPEPEVPRRSRAPSGVPSGVAAPGLDSVQDAAREVMRGAWEALVGDEEEEEGGEAELAEAEEAQGGGNTVANSALGNAAAPTAGADAFGSVEMGLGLGREAPASAVVAGAYIPSVAAPLITSGAEDDGVTAAELARGVEDQMQEAEDAVGGQQEGGVGVTIGAIGSMLGGLGGLASGVAFGVASGVASVATSAAKAAAKAYKARAAAARAQEERDAMFAEDFATRKMERVPEMVAELEQDLIRADMSKYELEPVLQNYLRRDSDPGLNAALMAAYERYPRMTPARRAAIEKNISDRFMGTGGDGDDLLNTGSAAGLGGAAGGVPGTAVSGGRVTTPANARRQNAGGLEAATAGVSVYPGGPLATAPARAVVPPNSHVPQARSRRGSRAGVPAPAPAEPGPAAAAGADFGLIPPPARELRQRRAPPEDAINPANLTKAAYSAWLRDNGLRHSQEHGKAYLDEYDPEGKRKQSKFRARHEMNLGDTRLSGLGKSARATKPTKTSSRFQTVFSRLGQKL
jgi:hypothetical protein